MTPQSIGQLGLAAASAASVSALISAIVVGTGRSPVIVTPYLALVLLVLALALLWAGWAVRRMRAHKRTWMTPIAAMRTAVAARAGALVGAVCLGLLVGVAVVGLFRLEASSMASSAMSAGLSALAALALTAVGVLVERWCLLGPDDDQDDDGRRRPHAPGTPA